ncbi:malto-oligosyltrehalose synthase [Planctomyces sp. SH-PL62]|uniref:malto-oligosyltrehalose synthase n=1 Tax=Planctomyces sp. SH-PL62 TaxID=1636152 RepID=UPI00078DF49B|nr:malto-oligosyltrehalose synthase [Planctomyces sp. SH-PL62]AMV37237.1 Maltooligosyl trehalose synthase [Planctomyces sp. SH-PL62]
MEATSPTTDPGSEAAARCAKDLLAAALEEIGRRRVVPTATYRVQLHAGFRFEDAARIAPYLAKLGITDLYTSPYLKAAPGSTHGYDIADHTQLNPEIGDEAAHEAMLDALRSRDLGLLLDVVPNHMGVVGNENLWWNDVLENGQASVYASYFDIDWSAPVRPENRGRILLPFLGGLYGDVLEAGDLILGRDGGAFHVAYHEHRFPLDPRSSNAILEPALKPLLAEFGEEDPGVLELQSILTAVRNLPAHSETDPARIAERNREKEIVKRRLASLLDERPAIAAAVDVALDDLDGTPGDPRSFDGFDDLLSAQPYRLAYWRVASDEINYRRFFDINSLAAIRADREEVLRATHRLVLDIVARLPAAGLRIDHPDGLLDPQAYLGQLQEAFVLVVAHKIHQASDQAEAVSWAEVEPELRRLLAATAPSDDRSPRLYVVVEKILAFEETLPPAWATHGTSGYDALNRINGLFVDGSSEADFTRQYEELIDDATPYRDLVLEKKQLIMDASLSSELHVLAFQLERIALRDRRARDFTLNSLRTALREVIAAFPVYRSYITAEGVSAKDRMLVGRAVGRAKRRNPLLSPAIFDFLSRVLLERPETPEALAADEPSRVDFAGKFQQVTSPVTAKGIEDTTFYIYNRLVSLNEVGGEPDYFGSSPASLHKWFARRSQVHPYALTALSTHDTKRSEDVRARIDVLSEIPDDWFDAFVRWADLNLIHHRRLSDDSLAPGRNEEYLLYQTLLGAWPTEEMDDEALAAFRDRVRAYMVKATREAKVHTSWQNPFEEYEAALDGFIVDILDRSRNPSFFKDFLPFQRRIALHGRVNGLAQSLLKLAGPGVPDTYQGTELWDFSLVDPDNRRPVDYALREAWLDDLIRRAEAAGDDRSAMARDLAENFSDGRGKLYLHWRALHVRRRSPRLFAEGAYTPLQAAGRHEASLFAFHRGLDGASAIVVVPRLTTRLSFDGLTPLGAPAWGETVVRLPAEAAGRRYRDAFTGALVSAEDLEGTAVIPAAVLFADFPVALLVEE